MTRPPDRDHRALLLCYDGSPPADAAIDAAGGLAPGRRALVAHVWVSGAPRLPLPEVVSTPEVRQTIEDVVAELDTSARRHAEDVAVSGTERARALGLDAEPLVIRVLGSIAGHPEVGVARALATAAEDHDAALVVISSRGRSQFEAAMLGSVSYGVLHLSRRPTLVVDAPGADPVS